MDDLVHRATINLPRSEWDVVKKVARHNRRSASSWARQQLIEAAEAEWANIKRKKRVSVAVKGTEVLVSGASTESNVA